MTHEDQGHYAEKHPEGMRPDPVVAERVQSKSAGGRIDCASAHAIASELRIPPADVGVVVDLLEIRIARCQLGLFGAEGNERSPKSPADVSADLEAAIRGSIREGRISCLEVWTLAKRFGIDRAAAGAACDALKVKISGCQLGAF